jgi:multidrug efflux system membrane fusion protein
VPVAGVRAPSQEPPAKAAATPAEVDQKPNPAHAPVDQKREPQPAAPSLEKVRVSQPVVREISDYVDLPGRIVAAHQVELRARVSGTLISVDCRPGWMVREGVALFKIDERRYRVELDKAKAELEIAQARRTRKLAELAYKKRLAGDKNGIISTEEVERTESELLEADAARKVAQSSCDSCSFNLELTEVRAPFAGTVSGPVLGLGNVAVADTTVLATIISTDPMTVGFNVDQNTVLRLNRLRHDGKIKGGAGSGPSVTVALPDEQGFPHDGEIDSVDIRIDPATGTARWRASIPNAEGLFLPGMFVRVRLVIRPAFKALLVPAQAVVANASSTGVYLVTDQNIVQRRTIRTTRDVYDGELKLAEGIRPDEWVIVDHEPPRPEEPWFAGIREGEKVVAERVQRPTNSGRPAAPTSEKP